MGYRDLFSSYLSNSRGVCILLNNNFEFKIHNDWCDNNGNTIAVDISIEKERYTLINIYGPNQDDPEFYNWIKQVIIDFNNTRCIICADFNLVLDPDKDSQNYININNPHARQRVLKLIEEMNLVDPYRIRICCPNSRRYTWR